MLELLCALLPGWQPGVKRFSWKRIDRPRQQTRIADLAWERIFVTMTMQHQPRLDMRKLQLLLLSA